VINRSVVDSKAVRRGQLIHEGRRGYVDYVPEPMVLHYYDYDIVESPIHVHMSSGLSSGNRIRKR